MKRRPIGGRGDLLRAVGGSDSGKRDQALAVMRTHPDPKAAGGLIHELRAGVDGVADVLVTFGEEAVEPLMRSLAKPRPLPAADVLARMGSASTDALLAAFIHPNRQVRTLAAKTVGRSDDGQVPFALLDRVGDSSQAGPTRVALVEWGRHHHQAPDAVLDRLLDFVDRRSPPEAVGELIVMLGSLEDPRTVPHLVRLLNDASARKWWGISLMMLSRLGDPMAERTFLAIASDTKADLSFRFDAIWGLVRLRSQAALPLLDQLAASAQQRPVLPSGNLPNEEFRKATEVSLREQRDWKLKLMAQAAAATIRDPSKSMKPDYELMQPISTR